MKRQDFINILFVYCLAGFAGCAWHGENIRNTAPDRQAQRPVNAYYLFSEAHLSLKKGRVDQAIEIMQQALALDPDSTYLKRELAGMWLMKKDTAAATELLDEILSSHPDDIDTLLLAGRVYQNLQNSQ